MYDPPAYLWAITIAGPVAVAALTKNLADELGPVTPSSGRLNRFTSLRDFTSRR